MKTALAWATIIAGGLCTVFGLWAIGAYIWGVIEILDEPDQSWIFWGLAILFLGIFSAMGGAALMVFGRRLLKR